MPGDREVGLAAEEVPGRVFRRAVDEIERADPEELARALAVIRGDDGRVDPGETAFVEVAVDALRNGVAHPRDGAECVRARTQVRHAAQVLEGMALLGDRVGLGVVHPADDGHGAGLDLPVLAAAPGLGDGAGYLDRAAGAEARDIFVVAEVFVGDDLHAVEAGAVMDIDERESAPRSAAGADPTRYGNRTADGDLVVQNGLDREVLQTRKERGGQAHHDSGSGDAHGSLTASRAGIGRGAP